MKNKLLILGIIIVAILAMGLPYLLRNTTEKPAPVSQETTAPKTEPIVSPSVVNTKSSVAIAIKDLKFSTPTVSVKKGTTITWTNKDGIGHTVTGDNGGPNSSLLTQDATYSYTFDKIGTYKYHCSPHPFMTGEVVVTE